MKFAQLNESTRTIIVGFQGEGIAVEYNARGYDDAVYKESVKLQRYPDDDPRRLRINNTLILRMVLAWDLQEEQCPDTCEERKDRTDDPICREHMMPITPEVVAALPNILRGRIVSRIMDDAGSGGDDDPKRNGTS